mmetsp:Transcript_22216/g.68542  ORF Transcript_22216/g.68542 Transcript_22216/m.68542 type:complete len:292 (-) Transcript_22216:27-902(-)
MGARDQPQMRDVPEGLVRGAVGARGRRAGPSGRGSIRRGDAPPRGARFAAVGLGRALLARRVALEARRRRGRARGVRGVGRRQRRRRRAPVQPRGEAGGGREAGGGGVHVPPRARRGPGVREGALQPRRGARGGRRPRRRAARVLGGGEVRSGLADALAEPRDAVPQARRRGRAGPGELRDARGRRGHRPQGRGGVGRSDGLVEEGHGPRRRRGGQGRHDGAPRAGAVAPGPRGRRRGPGERAGALPGGRTPHADGARLLGGAGEGLRAFGRRGGVEEGCRESRRASDDCG